MIKSVGLIFGGGAGVRMSSSGVPKQFLKVGGVPIIAKTLQRFQESPDIDAVVVVCIDGYVDHLKEILNQYGLDKVKHVVLGGKTGQESIRKGLLQISQMPVDGRTVILIHDAVRPMVTGRFLSECVEHTEQNGSAISYIKCYETVARVGQQSEISDILPRNDMVLLRAPQCFLFRDIWELHEFAIRDKKEFIDSASLALHYGKRLSLIQTEMNNIKITYPDDVYVLKALIESEEARGIIGF